MSFNGGAKSLETGVIQVYPQLLSAKFAFSLSPFL